MGPQFFTSCIMGNIKIKQIFILKKFMSPRRFLLFIQKLTAPRNRSYIFFVLD